MSRQVERIHKARRWGPGTAAVVRLLIWIDRPRSGAAIARSVGVSQPRAVQILGMLANLGAASSSSEGFSGDAPTLFDLYRDRTKPRVVEESFWFSTRPLLEQAREVASAAEMNGTRLGVSADVGPDLIVPWRHPTMLVTYALNSFGLGNVGFVTAEGRADASLILRRVADAALFGPSDYWPATVDELPFVDPVQQWWDLLDLGGDDRAEAAERLRRAILDRKILP